MGKLKTKYRGGTVKVEFADEKIAEICSSDVKLRKYLRKCGAPHTCEDIYQVLADLMAAPTAQDLPTMYHYHLLKYNLSGCAGVDVRPLGYGGRGKWRMVLQPISESGDINKTDSIKEVVIKDILINYHKGKD